MTHPVPTPQRDTLGLVQRCAAYVGDALEERDKAIRKAHADGETVREIAYWASLSPARVHQIIHGR